MHKWNMFRRTAPVVLSLVVAVTSAPFAVFAADAFDDGAAVEAEAISAEESVETEEPVQSETEVSVITDEIVAEAAEETEESEAAAGTQESEAAAETETDAEVLVDAEDVDEAAAAEEDAAEASEEIVFDAGEETAEADAVFADAGTAASGTATVAGTDYAWTKTAADGYTQIGDTGVYYTGTLPSGDYYGTATLTYREFYNGDVTDASASQYDAYASATTSKYSIQANEDVTLSYAEDGTTVSGYTINGVKNVSVKVSAETYVQAAILQAASALPGTGVYAEAAGITLNADPAAAVAQYKTLNSDGTYSATTFNTVATVTTATAVLETSSRWGDYVLEVTETDAAKYIRTGRSDDGFAVNSTILGVIVKTSDGTSIGLRHCYEIWVQPWEVAFSEDAGLQGKTITEVDYIMPAGVYAYTFASGVYVKTSSTNSVSAAFNTEGTLVKITGLKNFENPKATVYYTEGSGKKTQTYYISGSAAAATALTKVKTGSYTVSLNADASVDATKEYTVKITSDNYCDVTVSGVTTASGIVSAGGATYKWTTSAAAVDGYTNISGTNVYYTGSSMPTAADVYYGTASFTYRELYSGLVSDTSTSQYDAYASATTSKYSICSNEDVTLTYAEDGTTVSSYTIDGAKNVNVAVSAKTYVEAIVLEAADQLPTSGVYAEAAEIQLNKKNTTAVAQYKMLNADGTWAAMTLSTAATVTDATAVVETSSRWGDYVLEVTETSTKNIRNSRSDDGFAVNGEILGVIVKASDGTSVGLRHCCEIWVQPWEVAFSKDCGLQGKTITEIDYIMPTDTYVYTFSSGAYVKPQASDTVKAAVTATIVSDSTKATIAGLTGFTNPKISVYWVEGSGRNSKTTYLAEETAVTVKSGKATVTLNAKAEDGKEYTVKIVSDNYADLTTTAVAAEEKAITVKKDVINLKKKKSTTLKPTLTGGLTGKITYTSSNKKVATVNKNGKITAKNKTGYAKITIKCGSYKKVVKVYVNEKLTLKKSSATIKVKGKTTIKATTNIKGTITYTSSDTTVATVTKKGVVKGIKKGTATITVKCNGKTKKFKVKVK